MTSPRNNKATWVTAIVVLIGLVGGTVYAFALNKAAAAENGRRLQNLEAREARTAERLDEIDRKVTRVLTILEERKEKP